MTHAVIRVEQLGKTVTDSTGVLAILQDVSFSLAPKETAAIVGASGSGKSTLLSIMAGLDEDARAQLRARSMGFVFQSFQLLGHLSALENVMLPLELTGHANPKREAQEMLARVGLASRLSHYPKVLSGGEQQRVALARAFVLKPSMLMADEPTGSLDHATGETIMGLMLEMNRELATTLVLVTHDEALAARMDRRLHLQAGRLIEGGTDL